ncbi:MAG: hypothetical protein V5A37_04165 [Halobacteriales archaeon]
MLVGGERPGDPETGQRAAVGEAVEVVGPCAAAGVDPQGVAAVEGRPDQAIQGACVAVRAPQQRHAGG